MNVAPKMIAAPVKSAATPLIGLIFIIFPPTVLIIFQPPTDVPNPIAIAQEIVPKMEHLHRLQDNH